MDAGVSTNIASTGGKEAHRRLLSDLPYPQKVRIVVELQKIAVPIMKARGVTVRPWRLDEVTRPAQPGSERLNNGRRDERSTLKRGERE